MNLLIRAIRDAGEIASERLVLKVVSTDDIGRYAVFNTEAGVDGQPTNRLRQAFWFPDKKVKIGDWVVLYTKRGESSQKPSATGSVSHFFYWGLSKPMWASETDCAVLLQIEDWAFHGSGADAQHEPR